MVAHIREVVTGGGEEIDGNANVSYEPNMRTMTATYHMRMLYEAKK